MTQVNHFFPYYSKPKEACESVSYHFPRPGSLQSCTGNQFVTNSAPPAYFLVPLNVSRTAKSKECIVTQYALYAIYKRCHHMKCLVSRIIIL